MRSKRAAGIVGALAALVCFSSQPVVAQAYPSRAIKLVVPFAPGSPVDITARAIAEKMSASFKQGIVIENRVGAGGNLGTEFVARSAPDGYTLGLVLSTVLTLNPSLYKKIPFDPDKDVRPISIATTSGQMLVVHPSLPVHSVAEFVAYAKSAAARKEPLAYASGGIGTPGHLTMEAFRVRAGFEAMHVPYRGNPPMVTDLVGGQVKAGFVTSAGMMEHVQAGRLRGLGVSHASRSALAPEIPTVAEAGYPGFSVEVASVLLAPAGIPDSIAALLEREVHAALKRPDVIERFRLMDTSVARMSGSQVQAQLKADRAAWAEVVAAANMRVD